MATCVTRCRMLLQFRDAVIEEFAPSGTLAMNVLVQLDWLCWEGEEDQTLLCPGTVTTSIS